MLKKQEEHLERATTERSFYNSLAAASKDVAQARQLALGPHQANAVEASFHYSFDFAQQVNIL